MLKLALLALSMTPDGDVRVTLSDMADQQECRATQAMMTEIFEASDITLIATICDRTGLRLTPYEHGSTAADEVHRYRVVIASGRTFTIAPLPDGQTCQSTPSADPAVYCARSSQAVMKSSQGQKDDGGKS